MNHASLLETTAEVSFAFMGFVGIFLIPSIPLPAATIYMVRNS